MSSYTEKQVAALAVGDIVLSKKGRRVEVARLQRLREHIRVWVWPPNARRSVESPANLGAYLPTDTVEVEVP